MKRVLLYFILLSTTLLACGLMEALTDERLPTLIPTIAVRATTQAPRPTNPNLIRATNTDSPNATSTVTPTTAATANATFTTLPNTSTATAPAVAQATTSAPNQTATKTTSAVAATQAATTATATKGMTASSTTAASTATAVPTTAASTATVVPPSATRTNTVSVSTSTNTSVPTHTHTASPVPPTATKTNTPLPPTATFTSIPPTLTSTAAATGCATLNSGFENTVISLINSERAARGLGLLTAQSGLMSAAHTHSLDMACQNFLSHTGSDGSSPFDRMARFGYSYSAAAENVYAGSGPYNSPQAAFDGWMNSTGHRDNMLNPVYTQIGSGYAFNANSQYGGYFTTTFGKP